MREMELREMLRSVEVPAGSPRRAAHAIRAANSPSRRWRLLLATAIAVTVGFAFTAPGQATVDWVADVTHLRESDSEHDPFGAAVVVGQGTTPAGGTYEVKALSVSHDDVCMLLDLPPGEGVSETFYLDESTCSRAGGRGGGTVSTDFRPLPGGGVAAIGLADAQASSATVTSSEGEEINVDLFHLAGDLSRDDGTTEPLPAVTAYVAFLPAGIGNVEGGEAATFTVRSADGTVTESSPLAWAVVGEGDDAIGFDCGEGGSYAPGDLCARARSGELNRVDERLSQPLPPGLADLVADAGYDYRPGTDADRSIAANPTFELRARSAFALTVFTPVGGYDAYLGTLSGAGLNGRLAYVLPLFPRSELPDQRSAPPGPSVELGTFIVDALSGQTLDRIGPTRPTG